MDKRTELIKTLCEKIDTLMPDSQMLETDISHVVLFKKHESHCKISAQYAAGISFVLQGEKNIYVEGQQYRLSSSHYHTLLTSMPVQSEMINVDAEHPLIGIAVFIDQTRIANQLLKMREFCDGECQHSELDPSAVFASPLTERMLSLLLRLVEAIQDPRESAILGDAIVDEIYFRLLTTGKGGQLLRALDNNGQISQISRAVEHIHSHIERSCSVDELANLVNMSSSGFYKKFKEVMHLSPVQYAKKMKLNTAQGFILSGKGISEASYLVGYNSPTQFSREYKRHFGFNANETLQRVSA